MTRVPERVWSFVVAPLPIAAVCVSCYTWRLGLGADILAPVSFVAVCAVTFLLGAGRRRVSFLDLSDSKKRHPTS